MQNFWNHFTDMFNNREISLIFWLLIIISLSIVYKQSRKALWHLIKAYFQKRLIIAQVICWSFIAGVICIGYFIGLWNLSMLKDSIIWSLAVIIMIGKAIQNRKKTSPLLEILKDSVQPIVTVEFLVNLNPFALGWELVLLPILAILFAMMLLSERNPEHKIVGNFLRTLLAIWGIYILLYSIYQVIININTTDNHQQGLNFFMPLWLTVCFMPCLYAVMLYSRYEDTKKRVKR